MKLLGIIAAVIFGVVNIATPYWRITLAEESSYTLSGRLFSTEILKDQKGSYNYLDEGSNFKTGDVNDSAGVLSIQGNVLSDEKNVITVSPIDENEKYTLNYSLNKYSISESENKWFICSDNEKKVADVELDGKIKNGAFIVEISRDRNEWITLKKENNVFEKNAPVELLSYDVSPIQAQNKSWFRITVAYQLKKLDGIEKGFLGIEKKIYVYKKVVEVYEFQIKDDTTTSNTDPSVSPRREFRDIIAVKADKGYAKAEEIAFEKNDPQYIENERIGYFVLNGYSGNPDKNDEGNYVFTKNAGDDITLWFCLNKKVPSIFDIKGDGKVSISDDKKAYDKDVQTEETDFHYGALFVKYTNTEGTSRTVEYYDFLRSAASPAADTRVRIYEEGNYEVTLDYEIKSGLKKYDYKMNFSFEIKNGNCMVFFRDKNTTSELANMALAKAGFTVDFAGSRNLNVTFQRSSILEGANGALAEDIKENKGVNDLDVFEREGIYKFTIQNKSTGQTVYKTLYVGNSKYLKALSRNVIDINALNSYILNGATITEDGEIITHGASDTNSENNHE